MRNDGFSRG
uniref:Uncharacterized protein n=1 Tax=Arundo donax TaxID=35708 RepID=A0A0A8XQV4_ARUDO